MRLVSTALVLVSSAALLGGCAIGPPSPLYGSLYTNVTYPSHYQGAAPKGPGSKSGSSKATNILGLVATGDASVNAACQDGSITTVHTVDQNATNVLGLWAVYTTEVTGE